MNFIRKAATTLGSIFLAALLIAALTPTTASADEYTILQLLPGGDSISGVLTTDGTHGTVKMIDINSFSFGVSRSTDSGVTGSNESLTGADLSATNTSLQFNFSGTDGGEWILPVTDGGYIVWATANCQVCASIAGVTGGFVAAVDIDGDGITDVLSLSGVQTIGTAVTPEPATSSLMLIGVALLGLMMVIRTQKFKFRPNGLS